MVAEAPKLKGMSMHRSPQKNLERLVNKVTSGASPSSASDALEKPVADEEEQQHRTEPTKRSLGEPARWTEPGMVDGPLSHDKSEHVTDEVFNAASHLMAGMLSILGTAVLITGASAHRNPWAIRAFMIG